VTGALPSPFTATASQPLRQAPAPQPSPFTAAPPPQPQPATNSLIRPAEKDLTTIARLPYVHANSPESILSQLLKPEPIGASSALHHLTGTLERQAASRGSNGGVILITSAEPREGKTLVSSTLAAALCHQGRSVFMMECNPSSPTLHEWFPRTRGFEAWASDLEALRYSHTNLFLLPGRDLPAHATNELLDGYRTWIERARSQVDWIILDASPLLKAFANVAPLAPLATDVLIVSNPALTAPAKIRAGIALLQPMMSSSALRGMVLNGV
jgi:Mrp family chromosome partitioning ATPase